jgi:hypothetical protein
MGMRFVPPLLVVAVIVAGGAAPAAAKSVEVFSNGAHVAAVNANGAKKRGVVNRANAPQVAKGAKGRRPAKVANERKGSSGPEGSRVRKVHRATKGNSGVNGRQSVDAAKASNGNAPNAHCSSETRQQLEDSVTALSELARGMGICQMAQESVPLHTALASYHSRCVEPKGQIRASEYDRAAAQAQETVRVRCTTMRHPSSTPSPIPSPPPPRRSGPSR